VNISYNPLQVCVCSPKTLRSKGTHKMMSLSPTVTQNLSLYSQQSNNKRDPKYKGMHNSYKTSQ